MSSSDEKSLQDAIPSRPSLPIIKSSTNQHQPLRHTKSHNYDKKPKKKVKTLVPDSIPEGKPVDDSTENRISKSEREQIRLSIISEGRESRPGSRKGSTASSTKDHHSYDNTAFDSHKDDEFSISRNNSNTNSLRSSKNTSMQSLPVIREQYCCCARRTPCERILVASVAVLATIIVILVIAISLMASKKDEGIRETFRWKL